MELFDDDVNRDCLFKEYVPGSLTSTGHTGSLYCHWKLVRSQLAQAGFIKLRKSRKRKRASGGIDMYKFDFVFVRKKSKNERG